MKRFVMAAAGLLLVAACAHKDAGPTYPPPPSPKYPESCVGQPKGTIYQHGNEISICGQSRLDRHHVRHQHHHAKPPPVVDGGQPPPPPPPEKPHHHYHWHGWKFERW